MPGTALGTLAPRLQSQPGPREGGGPVQRDPDSQTAGSPSLTGPSDVRAEVVVPGLRVASGPACGSGPAPADLDLVGRLRGGDEAAFSTVVAEWSPMMLRVARGHVST